MHHPPRVLKYVFLYAAKNTGLCQSQWGAITPGREELHCLLCAGKGNTVKPVQWIWNSGTHRLLYVCTVSFRARNVNSRFAVGTFTVNSFAHKFITPRISHWFLPLLSLLCIYPGTDKWIWSALWSSGYVTVKGQGGTQPSDDVSLGKLPCSPSLVALLRYHQG